MIIPIDDTEKEKTIKSLVEYEIAGSWWFGFISNSWLQDRVAKYVIWKTKRKYKRYQLYKLRKKILDMTSKTRKIRNHIFDN